VSLWRRCRLERPAMAIGSLLTALVVQPIDGLAVDVVRFSTMSIRTATVEQACGQVSLCRGGLPDQLRVRSTFLYHNTAKLKFDLYSVGMNGNFCRAGLHYSEMLLGMHGLFLPKAAILFGECLSKGAQFWMGQFGLPLLFVLKSMITSSTSLSTICFA